MKRLRCALAAAILGALAGVAWLVLAYALHPAVSLPLGRPLADLATGLNGPERGPTGPFVWTKGQASFTFAGLDRRAPWTCSIRMRGARPDPGTLPTLTVTVDEVIAMAVGVTNTSQTITVEVPSRPLGRGLVLGLVVAPTFVPGPHDPRELGVMLEGVSCRPVEDAVMLPPPSAVRRAATAAALVGAAVALTGVTAGSAVGAAVVAAAGQALPLSFGSAPYGTFAASAAWLAFGIAVILAGGVLLAERGGRVPLRNTARFVAIFSAAAAYFKLIVLLHPDAPPGALGFHVDRLQAALSGHLSLAALPPGGGVLPDGVTLYLLAVPLVPLATDTGTLLRLVTVALDAVAGLWLYNMVARAWGDRLVGAGAVALFHLVPLSVDVLASGHLSASLGQSLAVVAMALVARSSLRPAPLGQFGGLTFILLAAFLASASTLAVAAAIVAVTAFLYRFRGEASLHPIARRLAASVAVAAAVAAAIYAGSLVLAGRPAPRAVADPSAWPLPGVGGAAFGLPVLALALAGLWRLLHAGLQDRLSLSLSGWILAATGYWGLALLTGIDPWAPLALGPALAVVASAGAVWLWHRPPAMRLAGGALLGWTVLAAALNWIGWLG